MRPLSCAALAAAALFAAPAYAPGVYSYRTGVRGEAILGRRQLALNATNATAADPTTVGEFCFLNRFRGFSLSQAQEQGIQFSQTFDQSESDKQYGEMVFDIACVVVGFVVCFFGWKLAQAAIWFVGFASGAIGFFWVTSWIMNLSGEFNCVVLGVIPLVGGVAGVCILNKIKRLAFFILGAAVGAAAGYYIYVMVVTPMEQGGHWSTDSHEIVMVATVAVPALLVGCCAIKLEDKILAVATAIIGGGIMAVGLTYLALARIDQRFVGWLNPCMWKTSEACTDGQVALKVDAYVITPAACALVFSLLGFYVQHSCQSGRYRCCGGSGSRAGDEKANVAYM